MRPSPGRLAFIAVVAVVLAAGLSAPAAGQATPASMAMHVALEPDGDAQWTVSLRFELDGANETAAFDRLAAEHVDGETDVLSAPPFRSAASLASEVTGRDMFLFDVTRTADRRNDTGVLRLSFTWAKFTRAVDGGERLVLGDVFATPAGTWLSELQGGQELVIEFPEGYAVQSSSRALDNGSIRVVGPATFQPGKPSALLERTGPVVTSPGTTTGPSPGTTPGPTSPGTTSPGQGIGVPSGLSLGAAVAILLVIGYLVYRRQEPEEGPTPEEPAAAGSAAEPVDEELLSDEERVLRLLRSEGGRMKQVDIVEETDWSNAKVSQLLSAMDEAGRIEKLRIGRENLISLPEDSDE